MKTVLLDTNILVRYLLRDNPKLTRRAKEFFIQAKNGKIKLYLDEVVVAEVVWLFSSFYKIGKEEISSKLSRLIAQDWVVNLRKDTIIRALDLYSETSLDYIDCWVFAVSKSVKVNLETFDRKLKKLRAN